jgi:cobalt-zinc-cadmium efflux system membrane fusion protein
LRSTRTARDIIGDEETQVVSPVIIFLIGIFMQSQRILRIICGIAVAVGLSSFAFYTREHWMGWLPNVPKHAQVDEQRTPIQEAKVLKLSPQARENLGLVSKPVKSQSYWKTILIPGSITDRPGLSDRGVTSPAVGIVVQVHAFTGDNVKPGDSLFTMRLFSEYLQSSQSELFKSTREAQIVKEQRTKIEALAKIGTLGETKVAELDQQLRRQTAMIQAHRQDLLTRGLTPPQIDAVADGKFVTTIEVTAPLPSGTVKPSIVTDQSKNQLIDNRKDGLAFEVQDLKVDLGQQVQAGQLLSVLANHQSLYIVGHAFKQEAPVLERAAQKNWPVKVEFADDDSNYWTAVDQTFEIHHLANTVDPASRTLDFFVPLTNQSRSYHKDDKDFVVWRFRPGQRVRLYVPIEEFQNVIVLPSGAIVREGPEAYVFRQNGDLFDRRPVRVLHEDRLNVVLANDGNITLGMYIAQSSAASLNRVLKAQAASGIRADVHVHADGTVHASH